MDKLRKMLDFVSSPLVSTLLFYTAVGVVSALCVYVLFTGRKAIWKMLKDWYKSTVKGIKMMPKLPGLLFKKVKSAIKTKMYRAKARRIKREHDMRMERLLELKEHAGSALIAWILQSIAEGEMTLEEAHVLQRTLARNLAMPSIAPQYESSFVKQQIKARRAIDKQGGNKTIPFPDQEAKDRRNGGTSKIFQTK